MTGMAPSVVVTSHTATSTVGRRRTRTTATLLAALLLTALVVTAPAGAAPGTVSLSRTTVTAGPDFATEAYANPWDYSDTADLTTDSLVVGQKVSRNHYVDGYYDVTVVRGGWLDLVKTIDGAIPYGRDGKITPIDSSRYSRMSVRMYSNVASTAQVYWFSCGETAARCFGATQFRTEPGWRTYDVAMTNTTGTPLGWSGPMTGLRLNPSATSDAHVALDSVRLYRPAVTNEVAVRRSGGTGTAGLVVDASTGPRSDLATPVLRDGRALTAAAGGAVTLDTSLLPAGAWKVGFRDAAGAVAWAPAPVTVAAPPAPVVLDPDAAGGADVTAAIRGGDAYDFSQASDVQSTDNVAGASGFGGLLHGTNGAPQPNANSVFLPVPTGFDGSRYHRLTFTASYRGPYGLQGTAGGGMVARLVWQTAGNPAAYQDLNDVVVVPGRNTITLDEDARSRIGWAGQRITALRFDPNEDPGNRAWSIDDIRIAQDDAGVGSYCVRFQDAAWAPGTTADVYVDSDAAGFDGAAIAAGVPVTRGVNSVRFDLGARPAGRHWVYTVLHRGGSTASAYSTGPVQMSGPVTPPATPPRGSLDVVRQGPGGIQVGGWAADPQLPTTSSTNVHFYVDGALVQGVTANLARPDVDRITGLGPAHGFTTTLSATTGRHQVCAYAIRAGGPNPSIGCRTVTVAAGSGTG